MEKYKNRKNVIIILIATVSFIFFVRLVYLQLYTNKYKKFAQNNVLQRRVLLPPRGLIYDRNGKILATNKAAYDLHVIPSKVKNIDTSAFCKIIDISKEDFIIKLNKAKKFSNLKSSVFIKNLSIKSYGILQERLFEFHGFFIKSRTTRKYPRPIAAHILGYNGEINQRQIEQSNDYYQKGDYVGISGLEKQYEKQLRGTKGEEFVLVNVFNIVQGKYMDATLDKNFVPGKHLVTSIDADVQEYAEKLFKNKKGGLVAIEPSSGEIIAMISSPSYDPSLLVGRQRTKNYIQLSKDKNQPLFNRAVGAMYPPGSVFKIAMALVGLDEGVITEKTSYYVRGGYYLPGLKIGDHVYGNIDFHNSIVKSSNAYYCHVFRSIIDNDKFDNIYDGYNNWRNAMVDFGMGKKIGEDLSNEVVGILPKVSRFDKMYGKNRWKSTNILSLAIGQAEISLTPLQIANFVSVVANRGYYITPHLLKAVVYDNQITRPEYKKIETNIDSFAFPLVINAMEDVLIKGTAIRYGPSFKELNICGKTGTSQNPHGEDHSVFICFAPKVNPKIVIATIVENAGQGAHWAAPISFLVTEKYLKGEIDEKAKWIEKIMLEGDFIHDKEEEEKEKEKEKEKEENTENDNRTLKPDEH